MKHPDESEEESADGEVAEDHDYSNLMWSSQTRTPQD